MAPHHRKASVLKRSALCIIALYVFAEGTPSPSPEGESIISSSRSARNHPTGTNHVIPPILADITSWQAQSELDQRPFVTLSFAQSLDGKIAFTSSDGEGTSMSSNLPLSGQQSLVLTHGLRSMHDAILVGGRTLSTDNPRLSNRLWGDVQPRPVILDPSLQHTFKLKSNRRARNVIVCCTHQAAASFPEYNDESLELLPCQSNDEGRLDLHDVLRRLRSAHGIRTVMVEGGAALLSAFLSAGLVDCLCVTIAPKLLGNNRGLACFSSVGSKKQYIDLACESASRFVPLGNDCIFLCQWSHEDDF
jgi:3,4-dihydroxy 2-butanone 4-phosphate synthase/GTP cyclohydrolase II